MNTHNEYRGYNGMGYGKLTATRLVHGKPSKIAQILAYLREYGSASKYEIVTEVLNKVGSRTELRGYYSTNFKKLRDSGLVGYYENDKEYFITDEGIDAVEQYPVEL
jgi:predicted transcriptional regulator